MLAEPTLRRPGFGQAIARLLGGLGRNAGTCVLLAAPVGALSGTAFALLGAIGGQPASTANVLFDPGPLLVTAVAAVAATGTVVLTFGVVYPLAAAGLAVVGARAVDGERTTAGDALAAIVSSGPRAIGAHLVSLLIVVGPPAGLAIGAVAAGLAGVGPAAAMLGLLAAVAFVWPGFVYFVRFALGVPVAANEDTGALDALERSSDLVRGGFWWVLGLLVLAAVGGGIVASIVSAPFPQTPDDGSAVGLAAGQALAITVSTAVSGVAGGVAYRVRALPPQD